MGTMICLQLIFGPQYLIWITQCYCCFLLLYIDKSSANNSERSAWNVEEAVMPVKNPCLEYGCICENSAIDCVAVEPAAFVQHFLDFAPDAYSISFTKCSQKHLDLQIFANFTSLRIITVRDCDVQNLLPAAPGSLQNLHSLDLRYNYLWDWNEVCKALNGLPSLDKVDLSYNGFSYLSHTGHCIINKLQFLNLSYNKISKLYAVPNAVILDLSSNKLTEIIGEWPISLKNLNLSNNPLIGIIPSLSALSQITHLNFDNCEMTEMPLLTSANLRHLSMQSNKLTFLNFDALNLSSLQELDLSNSLQLHSIIGMLPVEVKKFRLTNTPMRFLPSEFFTRAKSLSFVELMPNNWSCYECLIKWVKMLPQKLQPQLMCESESPPIIDCSIGISRRVKEDDKYILRARYTETAVLPCDAYGEPHLTIEWWLVRPEILLGNYVRESRMISMNWTRNGTYEIIPGGLLVIRDARKEVVERYRCIAHNPKGNASELVHFRLDYSSWYHLTMSESVFWGSILAAVITCGITFILNLLWIICRQIGLWWIKRIERNSRVREMVAAVERYRQRQMAVLSEAYHKKLEQVRENYHQQVEQVRASYALQSERFRDYRAAQMESMNQHIESIRDNYNQQICKLRDYGSRRVEQLWESYERQVNRLRMFSLQQRLGLMRKYKVKQQYLNKLAEKFADNPSEAFIKPTFQHPEVILTGPVRELDIEVHHVGSFLSLPEYVPHDEELLNAVQSELFQEFCRRQSLMITPNYIDDDDTPCSSQQPERRRSGGIELMLHRRHLLSNREMEKCKTTTLNSSDGTEPLDCENTSSR